MGYKESEALELKESINDMKAALRSIVAMLNKSEKGEIIFGIKDDGTVTGVEISDTTIRQLRQEISTKIDPTLYPEITEFQVDKKTCLRIRFEGSEIPYYVEGRAYTRVGDEDIKLKAKELEIIIVRKHKDKIRWDNRESDYSLEKVNENVLKNYIVRAKNEGRLSFDFQDTVTTLKKLKLMENNKLLRAAEVLFCDENHLKVQMAVFAGTERLTFIDIDDCTGNIFYLLEKTENYIKEHMDWRVEFGKLQRKEMPEIPLEALREALVNSLCHRDYTLPGNNEIAIYKDRIEIYNPGFFPEDYTPEDYINKDLPSCPRNPLIADTLYKSREIEQWGSGLKRIYKECLKQGITVAFKKLPGGFMTVFYRPEKKDIQLFNKKSALVATDHDINSIAGPPQKGPSILHRFIVYSIYGLIPGALWGLLFGRLFQESFNFTIALVYNMISGAIIGSVMGFSRKLATHFVYGFFFFVTLLLISFLATFDIRGIAYAFILGPGLGIFLSMLVKVLKNKGILL